MADFDPDAYLAKKAPKADTGFDPDAYLASKQKPIKAPPQVAPDTSAADKAALTGDASDAFDQHALNGATMGFGNKLQAALYAGILNRDPSDKAPFSTRYKEALGRADAVQANTDKAHPGQALAGDVVGSLATAPVSLGGGLARTAATGALQGGAYALGSDRSVDAGDTAKSVGEGALAGGALGGVLHGAGALASKAYSGTKSVVGRYLESLGTKAIGAEAEAENAGLRGMGKGIKPGKTPSDSEAAAVVSGEKPEALPQADASPEFDRNLESTNARRGMVGGHKNAAANQADNRLVGAMDVASSSDPEAAQFRANNARNFQRPVPGTKAFKSTPEYHNLEGGQGTSIVSRDEIAGSSMGGANKSMPARQDAPNWITQDVPAIKPGHEGQSAFDTIPGDGTGNTGVTPVASPAPREAVLSPLPALLKAQRGNVYAKALPEELTNAGGMPKPAPAPMGPAYDRAAHVEQAMGADVNQQGGGLASVLGGVYHGSKGAFPLAAAASMMNHSLGAAVEGAGAIGGAVKGGVGALSTADAYRLTKSAQNMLNSADPKLRMYGQMLLKSVRSTGADAAGSMTKEKADPKHGQPNDNRNN